MYLAKLSIKNFRSLPLCEINFGRGLNIIVGENNIGKSTVIDALRALLPNIDQQNLSLTELDIFKNSSDQLIELDYIFDDLTIEEEALFIEALILDGNKFQAHFHVRLKPGKYGKRLVAQRWCGAHKNETIPTEILEELVSVYLPPLRDPTNGLKPGYTSQIARLVKSFSSKEDEEALVKLVESVDQELKKQKPILLATNAINSKVEDIAGTDLCQKIDLSFAGTEFKKILGRLTLFIEDMDVDQNGLGYNNVIYTAAVLSQLTHENKAAYRSLLIEEPEAHLHPQLQSLLLHHLKEQTISPLLQKADCVEIEKPEAQIAKPLIPNNVKNESKKLCLPVQIIVTSHSPIFASQAPLDSIINLHNISSKVNCVNISHIEIKKQEKRKLERFLDSTRAELFFAKRLIMVEGIAEALLLPLFAKKIGIDLKKKAVSILNVQGLNFESFLALFVENGIRLPCAIIMDSDPDKEAYPKVEDALIYSSTAEKIKKLICANKLVKVFFSHKTFEYDLALNQDNLPTLLKAYAACHPQVANELETKLNSVADAHEKTKIFFQSFQQSCKSKGEFAQELADLIEEKEIFIPPEYTLEAIRSVVN